MPQKPDRRILGIDPGTDRIGYGLIAARGMKLRYLESGLLNFDHSVGEAPKRLLGIESALDQLIARTKPDFVGVEKLFFTKNKKTAMRVAEARGIIVKTAAARGARIREISPSAVKLAVTGNGRADKAAVAKMANLILGVSPRREVDDVTDAVAIAIAVSGRGADD